MRTAILLNLPIALVGLVGVQLDGRDALLQGLRAVLSRQDQGVAGGVRRHCAAPAHFPQALRRAGSGGPRHCTAPPLYRPLPAPRQNHGRRAGDISLVFVVTSASLKSKSHFFFFFISISTKLQHFPSSLT